MNALDGFRAGSEMLRDVSRWCQHTWLGNAAPWIFFPVIDNVLLGEPRCLLDDCGRGAPRCSFKREYMGGSSSSLEDMLVLQRPTFTFLHWTNQPFKNFPEISWCQRAWALTDSACEWLNLDRTLNRVSRGTSGVWSLIIDSANHCNV